MPLCASGPECTNRKEFRRDAAIQPIPGIPGALRAGASGEFAAVLARVTFALCAFHDGRLEATGRSNGAGGALSRVVSACSGEVLFWS